MHLQRTPQRLWEACGSQSRLGFDWKRPRLVRSGSSVGRQACNTQRRCCSAFHSRTVHRPCTRSACNTQTLWDRCPKANIAALAIYRMLPSVGGGAPRRCRDRSGCGGRHLPAKRHHLAQTRISSHRENWYAEGQSNVYRHHCSRRPKRAALCRDDMERRRGKWLLDQVRQAPNFSREAISQFRQCRSAARDTPHSGPPLGLRTRHEVARR